MVNEKTTKRPIVLLNLLLVFVLAFVLAGCSSSTAKNSNTNTSPASSDESSSLVSSLRNPGQMVTEDELDEEIKLMRYESDYEFWVHDFEQMVKWRDSGQQRKEWRVAMNDSIEEIKNYSPSKIPAQYRAEHQKLYELFVELRDSV